MKRKMVLGLGGAIIALAAVLSSTALGAGSKPAATVRLHGTVGAADQIGHRSTLFPTSVTKAAHAAGSPRVIPFHSPSGAAFPAKRAHAGPAGPSGPVINTGGPGTVGRWSGSGFPSLTDLQQSILNTGDPANFDLTPPDQGLCAGFLPGGQEIVLALVNEAAAEYDAHGHLLAQASLASFFLDPYVYSDPRCFYDPATETFFFTAISFDATTGYTVDDLGVANIYGFSLYQFDSSMGGVEYGDYPRAGFDANAFYISTDQFAYDYTTGDFGAFNGSELLAIQKSDLVDMVTSPAYKEWDDITGPGPDTTSIPTYALQPSFYGLAGDASDTEWLVNSFPYDASGDPQDFDELGLWWVTGDSDVTTASLNGTDISSQTYYFPVPAPSTGNGHVSFVSHCCPLLTVPVESEQYLNPDDSGLQQVQMTTSHGDPVLYTTLSSADPTYSQDVAAWFVIDPLDQEVTSQGLVQAKGLSILYPAIYHENGFGFSGGNTDMVFTLTGWHLNPSVAVFRFDNHMTSGQTAVIVQGNGPHLSFADPVLGEPRWGDYSAAVLDPGGNGMWMATEYIGAKHYWAPWDNWGTWVQHVQ